MAGLNEPVVLGQRAGDAIGIGTIVRLLRCEQWVKNTFVLGGLLFGGRLGSATDLGAATAAFVAFCLVASAGYLHNDIADIDADRQHPTKRLRPITAGVVPIRAARFLEVGLLLTGVALGFAVVPACGIVVAAYAVLTLAYSSTLKHIVILDVMAIAVGFVLRVLGGCAAVAVDPSVWIVLCTFLLAIFLGFAKRREELAVAGGSTRHRPVLAEYGPQFLDQMIGLAGSTTIICYIMFTVWPDTVARHGTTNLVYTVPLVVYGLFRYYFLVYQQKAGGSPTELVLTDRHLIVTVGMWALSCAGILYWH